MQKGIGAAPFAIVAALILALAGGLWATQPAQAAEGDVVLVVHDVNDGAGGTSFRDPGNDDSATGDPFGPAGLAVEITGDEDDPLEAAFGKDAANVFRGAADRGAWVEFEATVRDDDDDDASRVLAAGSFSILITVSGEASLSSSAALSSGTCNSQGDTNATCQFAVYGTGNAGDFSVEGAPGAGSLLTADVVKKAGSVNGQWVGAAVVATVLDAKPAESATTTDFGTISPAAFLSGTLPGLDPDQVGFLFQLTDEGGRVALNTATDGPGSTRDDLRVRVVTDTGDALSIDNSLSVATTATAAATQYVDIQQENGLGDGYPDVPASGVLYAGGLIAVGIEQAATDDAAALGRIVLDLAGGGAIEHAFAIAGDPDGEMSSVGAAATPVHLSGGESHKRLVTLLDANGTPVTLPANTEPNATPTPRSAPALVSWDLGTDAEIAVTIADAQKTDSPGIYELTITADCSDDDTTAAVACDGDGDDASVGLHSFTVTIDETEKTTDADGNPLEAHVGSGIKGLTIADVTVRGESLDVSEDREVTVGPHALLTITLAAIGSDDAAPANGSGVSSGSGSGFQGPGANAAMEETDDAGEVTFTFRAGTATETVAFDGDGAQIDLVIRIVDPDAPADAGPVTYSLASVASSTFHTWNGGDASSSEFENVANLVIVWKWTGAMWVGYVSSPNAPGATKTDFALANGDILWVVSTGPVDITLG